MAEERSPDFTFALADEPDAKLLAPLYGTILAGGRPAVSLGAVSQNDAVAWLQAQHERYSAAVGKRSGLLKSMKLEGRVDLVGLAP